MDGLRKEERGVMDGGEGYFWTFLLIKNLDSKIFASSVKNHKKINLEPNYTWEKDDEEEEKIESFLMIFFFFRIVSKFTCLER